MVVFDKDTIIVRCSCGCSCLSFKYEFDTLWITIFGDRFYGEQTTFIDLIKNKFKIIRKFISQEDNYFSDVLLSDTDFEKFVEYINELYNYASRVHSSPLSYVSPAYTDSEDIWKIKLEEDDFIFLSTLFDDPNNAPHMFLDKYQYFTYNKEQNNIISVNPEYAEDFKEFFKQTFPEYIDEDSGESYKSSHVFVSYDKDFGFGIDLRAKYNKNDVLKNTQFLHYEPSLNFDDFKKFVDNINSFYNKHKEDIKNGQKDCSCTNA